MNDPTALRARTGLGLGLYISRGIARAHGGDLVVHRTDATGSEFRLTLPIASRADEGARRAERAAD